MVQKILVTGAAGYIGGSILMKLLSRSDGDFQHMRLFACARKEDQVQRLAKLNVGAILLDLADKAAVEEAVLKNQIDIVIHSAASVDASQVSNIISALGQRRRASGNKTYLIHASVAALFSEEGGWTFGEVKDSDPDILEKEKQLGVENPVRKTNILLAEEGKLQQVTTLNVAIPNVYGRGTGVGRKLSVNIPAYIRTSKRLRAVHKFEKDARPPSVHIQDLAALYALIVEKILRQEPVPSGEEGHYFAFSHRTPWWHTIERLAEGLHKRGLVDEPTVKIWPSSDVGADEIGFPRTHIRAMTMSSGDLVSVNPFKMGWKPQWTEEKFLDSIDDEIDAAEELDTIKMSAFDSLMPSSKE